MTDRDQTQRFRYTDRPINEILYHYTTKETAIEKIFRNATLRMNPLTMMNDPRERDPWILRLQVESEDPPLGQEETTQLQEMVGRILKRSCRIVCFSQDYLDENAKRIPGFAHDRMWTQYAGDHTGVCIAFDCVFLEQELEVHRARITGMHVSTAGSIRYGSNFDAFNDVSVREMRRLGIEDFLMVHRLKFVRELYLTKNEDWRTEAEFRYIWIHDEEVDTPIDVPIHTSLSAVWLGAAFPDVYKPIVQLFSHKLGFRVYEIRYENGAPVPSHFTPYSP